MLTDGGLEPERASAVKTGRRWRAVRPKGRASEAREVSKRKSRSDEAIGESLMSAPLLIISLLREFRGC
ncbi:MAG: hypothetical protein LBK67_06540 [Coriobacteriales bacterium]|nr:hypothetical protein [Coriobacteriales bacterium]